MANLVICKAPTFPSPVIQRNLIATVLYSLYAAMNLGLAIWGMQRFQQDASISMMLLTLVLLGMTYDNLIILLGQTIAVGHLLQFLNRLRFIIHHLCVPLLVIFAIAIAKDAGVTWAREPLMQYGNYAIAAFLIGFGLFTVTQQELIPIREAGTLRYKPSSAHLPIPTLLTALLVAIVGGYIWTTSQWPWMFVGTIVMLGVNALPRTGFSTMISSSGDLLFIVALFTTALVLHS